MSSALPEEALLPPLLLPLMLPERPASLSWRDRSSFQASNSAVTCRISHGINQVPFLFLNFSLLISADAVETRSSWRGEP